MTHGSLNLALSNFCCWRLYMNVVSKFSFCWLFLKLWLDEEYAVHKKSIWRELSFILLCISTCNARECKSSGRGARRLAAAHYPRRVFWLNICNYRCHRYLHAKFHWDWPSKKPSFFHLNQAIIVFRSPCTRVENQACIYIFQFWETCVVLYAASW